MSAKKHGVLVCVDGSAASDAAVAWGTREAVMRGLPITLMYAVPPVVVGWPVGQLYADMPEWQQDSAQHVIDQARKMLRASLGDSEPPEIHTETVYSAIVPALIEASKDAWMLVAGSQGLGALGRLLLGSVTAGLLHYAHCPVAVIHSDEGRRRTPTPRWCWASTGRRHRKPRPPWPSTKRHAGEWGWWRCTCGATWGVPHPRHGLA